MSPLDPRGLRVAPAPAREVQFTLDGRTLSGVEGEPIAVALHAQGVQVLGRSMKHRRPRGLHCIADACPSCALRVNGVPGVTSCTAPLRAGDVVERQRGLPSADVDVLALMDRLSRLAPIGFQYRRLRSSPRLFRYWERILARLAGSGDSADPGAARAIADAARWETGTTGVAVVGGGAAGLAAALAAARAGSRVTLVERRPALGGWPGARDRVAELERAVAEEPGIDVRTGATAIGWYAEGVLAIASPGGMLELRPDAVVLATGAHERPLAFPDNDRPGVMLAGGVERLLVEHRVRPGRRVAVVTTEDYGAQVATQLAEAGVEVAVVADVRAGEVPRGVVGRKRVRGLVLETPTGSRTVACDAIVVANGRRPARELLLQRAAAGGLEMRVPTAVASAGADPSRPAVDGFWLAGGVAGASDVKMAIDAGTAAGRAAAEGAP